MALRLTTLMMVLVLGIYAFLGGFARPEIDDWCNLAGIAEHGLWESTLLSYQTWTGRILYSFVVNLVAATQPWSGQVLPALLLALTVVALRYAAAPFTRAPLLVAIALTYALLQGPNLWQVFYIPSAVLNYLPPLLATATLASWLYRRYSVPSPVVSLKDSR